MGVKTLAYLIAFTTCCHGAVILSEIDEWFEAGQSFLMDPEPLVTAFGAQRVKRDTGYDKEFILVALGVGYGINTLTLQPNERRKSLLLIPNEEVRPISSEWNSRSSDVFDNGDAVYGFFTMSVVYTLTHSDRSSLGNNIYSFKEEG